MDAEQVVEKILSEANAEAEKITSQAKAGAAKQESELESELAGYRQETQELAAKAAADKKSRMLATARMDIRKEILAAKVGLVNEVFAKAGEKIKAMGDDEYRSLVGGLMQKAVETGDEEVVIGAGEKRIDEKFIKNVNRELGPGFKGNLRLADETAEIAGGFILRRGKIQINVSTDVLLERAKEELEIELTKELFGE
jgi:V/A-type H+-transporting ATPase subunit E